MEDKRITLDHTFRRPKAMKDEGRSYSKAHTENDNEWYLVTEWTDTEVRTFLVAKPLACKFEDKRQIRMILSYSAEHNQQTVRKSAVDVQMQKHEFQKEYEQFLIASFSTTPSNGGKMHVTVQIRAIKTNKENQHERIGNSLQKNSQKSITTHPTSNERVTLNKRVADLQRKSDEFYETIAKTEGKIQFEIGKQVREIVGPFKWRVTSSLSSKGHVLHVTPSLVYDEHNNARWSVDCVLQNDIDGRKLDFSLTNKSVQIPPFFFSRAQTQTGSSGILTIKLSNIDFSEHPKTLLKNPAHSGHDLVISCCNMKYYLHSQILSVHSKGLKDLIEKSEGKPKQITLDEGDHAGAVYSFLLLMYNARLLVEESSLRNLDYLGNKYGVAVVIKAIADFHVELAARNNSAITSTPTFTGRTPRLGANLQTVPTKETLHGTQIHPYGYPVPNS